MLHIYRERDCGGGGGGGDEGGGSKEGRVSGMRRTMRERNWELRGKERRALVREGRRKKT